MNAMIRRAVRPTIGKLIWLVAGVCVLGLASIPLTRQQAISKSADDDKFHARVMEVEMGGIRDQIRMALRTGVCQIRSVSCVERDDWANWYNHNVQTADNLTIYIPLVKPKEPKQVQARLVLEGSNATLRSADRLSQRAVEAVAGVMGIPAATLNQCGQARQAVNFQTAAWNLRCFSYANGFINNKRQSVDGRFWWLEATML